LYDIRRPESLKSLVLSQVENQQIQPLTARVCVGRDFHNRSNIQKIALFVDVHRFGDMEVTSKQPAAKLVEKMRRAWR
jgi:hypothetical protein